MKSVVDILNNNYIDCFRMANPYPHIIFNEFFSNEESNILFEETKKIKKWNDIHVFKDVPHISNRLVADYSELNGKIKNAIDYFYSNEILSFVSSLVGVDVFGDSDSLRGGGLQRANNGAYMDVHLDNNWNQKLDSWTVANAIYYLSTDWKDEYGGDLELWKDGFIFKTIKPDRNKCVFCINNFKSYHGYSKKINCPDDKYRQSLIMFYYSKKQIDNMEKRNGAYWKNKW